MKIAILGYGVEGQSAYKYWLQQTTDITIHDQNPNVDVPLGAKSILGPDAYNDLDQYGYDFIVRSPGSRIDRDSLATLVTTPTAEFFEKCPVPIIGITGTKGKGTTSALINEILMAAGKTTHLLGNIGTPALDELEQIQPGDFVVFELSSFQLIDLPFSPHVAVHLMLEPDHMDWHADQQEYVDAKANIFRNQTASDIAVYYDSSVIQASAQLSAAELKIPFDRNMKTDKGVRVTDGQICVYDTAVASVSDVSLQGEHMLDNVCAAVAATWALLHQDMDQEQLKSLYGKVLQGFSGLPHRVQLVAEINGVKYIDDSYSANPSAAQAGLRAFKESKVAILGGYDKGAEYDELAQTVKNSNVSKVIAIGVTAAKITEALNKVGYTSIVEGGKTMHEIVTKAAELAQPGEVVLLSPGCASFDMFQNFSDRGDQFIKEVERLKKWVQSISRLFLKTMSSIQQQIELSSTTALMVK